MYYWFILKNKQCQCWETNKINSLSRLCPAGLQSETEQWEDLQFDVHWTVKSFYHVRKLWADVCSECFGEFSKARGGVDGCIQFICIPRIQSTPDGMVNLQYTTSNVQVQLICN